MNFASLHESTQRGTFRQVVALSLKNCNPRRDHVVASSPTTICRFNIS